MRKFFSKLVLSLAAITLLFGAIGQASAGSINVYVGYADGLRGGGVFPSIWDGSLNTTFVGTTPNYDAGAIRIDNFTGAAITIDSVIASMHWIEAAGWNSGYLWGTHVLADGFRLPTSVRREKMPMH